MLSKNYLISRFYQQIKFLITFITIGTMFAQTMWKFLFNATVASIRLYCWSSKHYCCVLEIKIDKI